MPRSRLRSIEQPGGPLAGAVDLTVFEQVGAVGLRRAAHGDEERLRLGNGLAAQPPEPAQQLEGISRPGEGHDLPYLR